MAQDGAELTRARSEPIHNKTDEELARDLKSGDRDALSALVVRYDGPLRAYIFSMCCNYHLSQDIVQECLIRVISRIQQYRYPRPFRPWIFAIARNLLKDHMKSAAARREVPWPDLSYREITGFGSGDAPMGPETDGIAPPEGTTNSVEDILFGEWERKRVLTAVQELPDPLRETLMLRYFGELSLAEIAKALRLPIGTVKSRLSRAIHRLAEVLGKEEEAHVLSPQVGTISR